MKPCKLYTKKRTGKVRGDYADPWARRPWLFPLREHPVLTFMLLPFFKGVVSLLRTLGNSSSSSFPCCVHFHLPNAPDAHDLHSGALVTLISLLRLTRVPPLVHRNGLSRGVRCDQDKFGGRFFGPTL